MKDIKTMEIIQNKKAKELSEAANPAISPETIEVFSRKKASIDQPYTETKYDPLR